MTATIGTYVDEKGGAWRFSVQDDSLWIEYWPTTDATKPLPQYAPVRMTLDSLREVYSDTLHQPDQLEQDRGPLDLQVWNQLTGNFWLPEKIAVSNDLASWRNMTDDEKTVTKRVFAGLTALDTVQATVGAVSLMPDAITQHEEAVYTNIAFMESVHARSYSNIFSTLCSSEEIEELFRWARENEQIQRKEEIILKYYDGDDPLKRKIASTLLESFLFYSGFFWPFYLSSRAKLTNSADIVRLIVRDEAVHGFYIGYKFQQGLPADKQSEYQMFATELLLDLYDNEVQYTQDIYDGIGLTEKVKTFLRYNADKALQNLGFPSMFPADEKEVDPAIMSSLSLGGENHDFFSGGGSTYTMAKAEETTDDDWEF